MQRKTERLVHFMNLAIRSETNSVKGLPPKTAKDIARYLNKLVSDQKALKSFRGGAEHIYISDMKIAQGVAYLLINRSDQNEVDPIFSDPKKRRRRTVRKSDGEGHDYSSHIVWDLTPDRKGNHLFLMEFATGITTRKVVSLFNHLLRYVAKCNPDDFSTDHYDGSVDAFNKPRKVQYRSRIELRGHISDEFKRDLKEGTMKDVEIFTETRRNTNWDEQGYTVEKVRSISIAANPRKVIPNPLSLLKRICGQKKAKPYEYVKIAFTTAEDDNRTATLYTDTLELADSIKYVKRAIISDFTTPLEASYETLYAPILKKMKALA